MTITLNNDGTFTAENGDALTLRDVIAAARIRRDEHHAAKREAHSAKKAERAAARLERAKVRAEKAQAELAKAEALAA